MAKMPTAKMKSPTMPRIKAMPSGKPPAIKKITTAPKLAPPFGKPSAPFASKAKKFK